MDRYKLQITGYSLRYFLNNLIKNKIQLYYINQTNDRLIIIVNENDFNKIKKMKTTCKVKVLNRFGIEKIKYLVYKYRYLLLFFLIGLFLILTLSNIIFEIEVVHPKKEIRNMIYDDLKKYGIKKYTFTKNYEEKEKIKEKILKKEKNKIEWLEIDKIGTKYIVNVEERKKKITSNDNTPRDIIAKKDGMILKIQANNGEIVKKKYDYVKKGDIIISGTIKNKEDEVNKIKATGVVYGEVWYNVKVEIPIKYHEEIETGREKQVLAFRFLNKDLFFEFNKYKEYNRTDKYLIRNEILPIGFSIVTKKEKISSDKIYNINNIDKKAIELAEDKFNKKNIIFEKVLKKTLNDSTITVEVFLKVKENITAYQKIENLELKKEEDDE